MRDGLQGMHITHFTISQASAVLVRSIGSLAGTVIVQCYFVPVADAYELKAATFSYSQGSVQAYEQ